MLSSSGSVFMVSDWPYVPFSLGANVHFAMPVIWISDFPLWQIAPHLSPRCSAAMQLISRFFNVFDSAPCAFVVQNNVMVAAHAVSIVFVMCFVPPLLFQDKNKTTKIRWLEVRNYKRV